MKNKSQDPITVNVPLTRLAHSKAQQFCKYQPDLTKAQAVYLNTLAVYAVSSYLGWIGIDTDLEQSDSWNPIIQTLSNVASLEIKGKGQIECIPVLKGSEFCHVPPEVWSDRIGYVAVQIDKSLEEAELLGFLPTVQQENIPISQFTSLENLLSRLADFVPPVKLGDWLLGMFDEGWHSLTSALNHDETLAFSLARSSIDQNSVIERAKKIDLGLLVGTCSVALVISIKPGGNDEIDVIAEIIPMGGQKYLPQGLKFRIELESDSREIEAREADNMIRLEFSELHGKQFTVQISFEDAAITERFVI
jgi:hypothetical protein